jgi:hypothetical protein
MQGRICRRRSLRNFLPQIRQAEYRHCALGAGQQIVGESGYKKQIVAKKLAISGRVSSVADIVPVHTHA